MEQLLEIARPFDAHVHLRDGAALATTAPASAAQFSRALVMPNLVPPITTVAGALAYRERILDALAPETDFEPLFALYLTDETTPAEVQRAAEAEQVIAFKLYPSGATTNSQFGVTDLEARMPVLTSMAEQGVVLCVHGEATAADVDVFDREKVFIEETLRPLLERLPSLRVVLEHITTHEAVQFVEQAHEGLAATITPQHLLMNRNDLFAGGLRPHNYCLPVLKRRTHQDELRRVAISGNPRFFLGTDSAPHASTRKEAACGCAGCFSAPAALELYAEVFDQLGSLERLEAFAAHFGADFYGLPRDPQRVSLVRKSWVVPQELDYLAGESITPYYSGRELTWQLR